MRFWVKRCRCKGLAIVVASRNILFLHSGVHYPVPIHMQPAYRGRLSAPGSLPETEKAAREVLSLPMFPELSEDQILETSAAIRSWDQQHAT